MQCHWIFIKLRLFAVINNSKYRKVRKFFKKIQKKYLKSFINFLIIFRQYQLPDCEISLKLFNDNPSEYVGTTVQVFGEVRLYDPEQGMSYNNLESSHSLIQRLQDIKSDLETKYDDIGLITMQLKEQIEKIKKTFLPIIQVHNIKVIHDAKEIISENLNFRLLQKKRDEFFHHVPNS